MQPAVSEGLVLPTFGVKQQTTMLVPYGMLPRASRHFFSDGATCVGALIVSRSSGCDRIIFESRATPIIGNIAGS